ncbi:hypothetical protein [Paenibacillus sp. FSL M7-1046]|uniref:hypothetical protein n=1 Tax=Paenibacillus sp. FSL M7-1046 TaxID=2975315 RepID=UPI0030FB8056
MYTLNDELLYDIRDKKVILSLDDVGFILDDNVSVFIFKKLCDGPIDLASCVSTVRDFFAIETVHLPNIMTDIELFLNDLTAKNIVLVS